MYFKETTQKGAVPILILVAVIGVIAALSISGIAPFKDKLLSSLYPKPASEAATSATISVNFNSPEQTWEGFGSTVRELDFVSSASVRQDAIRKTYGKTGVHLTTGGFDGVLMESTGGWNGRQNDNNDPFSVNWSGFDPYRLDSFKTTVLDEIATLLPEEYQELTFYFGQRPSTRWNMTWLEPMLLSSDPATYQRGLDEAAEYVLAGYQYWKNQGYPNFVLNLNAIYNEPTWGNAEVAQRDANTLGDIIKTAGQRLEANGFTNVKFVYPNETSVEGASWQIYPLDRPDVRKYIGAIGYHPYSDDSYININSTLTTSGMGNPNPTAVENRNYLRDQAKQYGLPTYMTEVAYGSASKFDGLRARAIHIHDEMEYANASAYYPIFPYYPGGIDDSEVSNVVAINGSTVSITGMGYAIGHYSHWINKGAIRVNATSTDPLVQISSFRDVKTNKAVFVLINNNTNATSVTVNLANLGIQGPITGEQSTQTAFWQPITSFNPTSASSLTISLPALSVTSLAAPTSGTLPSPTPTPSAAPSPSVAPSPTPPVIAAPTVNTSGFCANQSSGITISWTAGGILFNQIAEDPTFPTWYNKDLTATPGQSTTGPDGFTLRQTNPPVPLVFNQGQIYHIRIWDGTNTSANTAFTIPACASPSPSAKPGDTDNDGDVDIFDYNILLTNFGKTGTGVPGDIDGNNKVDIFDYNILLTNFGL